MSDNDLICICMAVSRGEIQEKIRQGATTLDELKADLLCCTGCGTCEGRVRAILDASASETIAGEPAKKEDSA